MSDQNRITASDFLDREAGGDHDLAVIVAELQAYAYAVTEHFVYMPERVPADWLAAVKLINETELKLFPTDA